MKVFGLAVAFTVLAVFVWLGWCRFIDWIGPRIGDDDF